MLQTIIDTPKKEDIECKIESQTLELIMKECVEVKKMIKKRFNKWEDKSTICRKKLK